MKKNVSLKDLTTIKIGGSALYYAPVATISELQEIVDFSRARQLPFYLLGNGSNVLISDNTFAGIVLKLVGALKEITFYEEAAIVSAGAGALLMELGDTIAGQGFLGCAYMGVIPGTVGGAVRMNAGTLEEGEIQHHFLSARVLNPETGQIAEYTLKDMHFSYRTCVLSRSRNIIINASFRIPSQRETVPGEARAKIRDILALRHAKQPREPRNFGSTFKRPPGGNPPGWYLERVSMKGVRIGGAMVAEEHANWILNVDNAKSQDVKDLIALGQKRVKEEFGIQLEREVIYLPEDMEVWQ